MAIEYLKGNLLHVTEGVIAHGCNCRGVMGSGVARAIKETYPSVYRDYLDLYQSITPKELLGKVQFCSLPETFLYNDLFVANMFTQLSYGMDPEERYVSYDAIDSCFKILVEALNNGWALGTDTVIHIPKIGAGLGNGNWNIIEKIILEATKDYQVIVWEL